MAMLAFVGGKTFEDLISDFQAFEMNDADVFGNLKGPLNLAVSFDADHEFNRV